MPRNLQITLAILGVAVLFGLLSLRGLHERVQNLGQNQVLEEQARREVVTPSISTPTDVKVPARIFWISSTAPDRLDAIEVELALSADPALRAKQVLGELIGDPPTPPQRTLPSNATLLDFYVLPGGTGVADFSDSLSTEMPSGILSEAMALNSILHTLESNVPSLRRLKILIHGQEAETVAGHVDLTGFFDLHPPASPTPAGPAGAGVGGGATASGLTGTGSPGKLNR